MGVSRSLELRLRQRRVGQAGLRLRLRHQMGQVLRQRQRQVLRRRAMRARSGLTTTNGPRTTIVTPPRTPTPTARPLLPTPPTVRPPRPPSPPSPSTPDTVTAATDPTLDTVLT